MKQNKTLDLHLKIKGGEDSMEIQCKMPLRLQLADKDLVSYYHYVQEHKEIGHNDYKNYKNASNGNEGIEE